MLVGLRRDVGEALVLRERSVIASWTLAVAQPDHEPQPAPDLVDRADLVVDQPGRRARSRARRPRSCRSRTFDARLGHAIQSPAAGSIIARSDAAAGARGPRARGVERDDHVRLPAGAADDPHVRRAAPERAPNAVRRAEQRTRWPGLDAELARQRRARVAAWPRGDRTVDRRRGVRLNGAVAAARIRSRRLDLRPVFQPIVDLRDGTVVGYEALLRGDGDGPRRAADAARGGAPRGQPAGARSRRAATPRCARPTSTGSAPRSRCSSTPTRATLDARPARPPADPGARSSSRSPSGR